MATHREKRLCLSLSFIDEIRSPTFFSSNLFLFFTMVNQNIVLTSTMAAAVMAGTMGDMPVLGACGARQPSLADLNYRYPADFKGQPVKRQAPPEGGNSPLELPIVFHMCCPNGKCPASVSA